MMSFSYAQEAGNERGDFAWVMMPELRSRARRSKRLGDLHPDPQTANQDEILIAPAQARTRRGRGRGNATAVAKGPSAATPTRPAAAGRGRGVSLIDLEPERPRGVRPQTVGLGAPGLAVNRVEVVEDKDIVMAGGSRDKIMGVEEEASTTPVPERVFSCLEIHWISFLKLANMLSYGRVLSYFVFASLAICQLLRLFCWHRYKWATHLCTRQKRN